MSESAEDKFKIEEFISEKRKCANELNEKDLESGHGSARTSAYEPGKIRSYMVDNEDGALTRYSSQNRDSSSADYVEERLKNLENHLGVISPPHYPNDVYARLKVLEDKIMRMEELYPQISAHLLNYQDRTDDRLGGRVTRAPGFYKELTVTRKKKNKNLQAPIGISIDAAQASDILKTKMEELRNKLMK